MTGRFNDISAKSFFRFQINKNLRNIWDQSLKELFSIHAHTSLMDDCPAHEVISKPLAEDSEDLVYCRTKWPWPLKDRDYTLTRRYYELIHITIYI